MANFKNRPAPAAGFDAEFVNPYNFVPFGGPPQRCDPDPLYANPSALRTGWLDVTLTTKTPLIIPDGAHPTPDAKQPQHKHYRFFTLPDGRCAIPGSELRGMLRSVYEAASNSCLPFLLDDKPLSQRTVTYASFQKRGLLQFDPATRCWSLYKAKADKLETDKRSVEQGRFLGKYKNGDKVRFSFSSVDGTVHLGTGDQTGWVQFNVPVDYKRPYHVAVLTPQSCLHTWPAGDNAPYSALLSALDADGVAESMKRRDASRATHDTLRQALKKAQSEGGMVPVWFFSVQRGAETLYYLSCASIGRVAQRRKWADIMQEHAPCVQAHQLCPACLLFGTAADGGRKGRVRVTDALPAGDAQPVLSTHLLPILGGPRPSAFEFYLKKPEPKATYWNFDYYGVPDPGKPRGTVYRDLARATPRGRKMYWHSAPAPDAKEKNQMNATMQAVDSAAQFTFRLYFDSVTPQQLQDLIWVITLGDNRPGSSLRHKLGHAKPLGYGSVKLTVTGGCLRSLTRMGDRLAVQTEPLHPEPKPPCSFDLTSPALRSLLAMADAQKSQRYTVRYPARVDRNGENIYTWFAKNRTNAAGLRTLPEPTQDTPTLRGQFAAPVAPPAPLPAAPARSARQVLANGAMYTAAVESINPTRTTARIKITANHRVFFGSLPLHGQRLRGGSTQKVRITGFDSASELYTVELA